jgi:sodium-dependent phosphate cotransporter|tara:strand:+ start:111 stop:1205 length:1095 start_codon:yes stop_codon:yes gene_type:complete
MNENFKILLKILGVFLALYLFLVGINGLSSGIKLLGGDFAKQVMSTTGNPFVALFIGILATTLFQSSSTTSSLIVAMVGSGTVTLSGAVPMIMGANIGTTVTNTIVSIGHIQRGNEFKRAFQAATIHDFFNLLAVLVLFPIEYFFGVLEKSASWLGVLLFGSISTDEVFKSPIKAAIKWGSKQIQQLSFDNDIFFIILSVLLTFLMLYAIVKLLRSLVLEKVEVFFDTYIFKTAMRAMIFGMLLTISVQSSSITTSTIVPLAGAGVLSLRQIYPFTLGANIGTTVTALLASLTLNVTAMVAAFAHLFFNIFGIIVVYLNPFLRDVPIKLSEKFSDLAIKNKFIPVTYLVVVFFIIPFLIIFLGR